MHPIFVEVLLHHETKQKFVFCIDSAKVHLQAISQGTKNSYVLMKLELRIILKLFLNLSDFEPFL